MSYEITGADKTLVKQNVIHLRVKMEVLNSDGQIINCIEGGIVSGSSSVDAESDIRRTFSLTFIPDDQSSLVLSEDGIIWLDKKVKMYIGIMDNTTQEYTWYPQGVYLFMSTSSTYDITTNQVTVQCSDMMSLLDGSRNGNLGQYEIDFPAYEEDETTGVPIKYNYIRDAMITTVDQLGLIDEYQIDWIGEAKAFPHYEKNWDYLAYRESTLVEGSDGNSYYQCFTIPADQVFEKGCTVLEIITALRDLYENYEAYFDENGIFICHQIPQGEEDLITFDYNFFNDILVSESVSFDLTEVKNVEEVWGETFDPEYYTGDTSKVSYSNGVYSVTLEGYTDDDHDTYYNGDEFAFIVTANNPNPSYININSLGNIPIYDENTETFLEAGTLVNGYTYCFKIKKRRNTSTKTNYTVAYYEGLWQVHCMDVLTDGTVGDNYTSTSGTTTKKFSKEWFQDVYNCVDVHMTTIPDSPFTIQKLGVILEVYDNEDITSASIGIETARQEGYRNYRLTDSISIVTKICPFADVNIKVTYKRSDADEPYEYLVKSVSHDWENGQTTWTLTRFYELYLHTYYEVEKFGDTQTATSLEDIAFYTSYIVNGVGTENIALSGKYCGTTMDVTTALVGKAWYGFIDGVVYQFVSDGTNINYIGLRGVQITES